MLIPPPSPLVSYSKMDMSSGVEILEKCEISPPPASVTSSASTLPLTFFDIPWLLFPPHQPLFFYHHPALSITPYLYLIPKLKHSLSLSLQHFYPFAGKLASSAPEISYTEGDSVPMTIAQSDSDFYRLCADAQKKADELHQLVPHLTHTSSSSSPGTKPPSDVLMAVQVTVFPNSGFSIGLAYHHMVCDQRTFNNFLRSWTSFCKLVEPPAELRPSFDRSVIVDSGGLTPLLLKQWRDSTCVSKPAFTTSIVPEAHGMVRATFLMGPSDIESARQQIIAQCIKWSMPQPPLLSAYVVTCATVWACLTKAKKGPPQKCDGKEPVYLGFIAGGITRLSYGVPSTYFGNCVAFGRAEADKGEMLGDDGIVAAAHAIGRTVKELDRNVLGGAEKWISDWEVLIGSDQHMNVMGSPKVELYKTDFGWGRPKKIEEVSIDVLRGMSLAESRDMKGGIEIGLTLPKSVMDAFTSLFSLHTES